MDTIQENLLVYILEILAGNLASFLGLSLLFRPNASSLMSIIYDHYYGGNTVIVKTATS